MDSVDDADIKKINMIPRIKVTCLLVILNNKNTCREEKDFMLDCFFFEIRLIFFCLISEQNEQWQMHR